MKSDARNQAKLANFADKRVDFATTTTATQNHYQGDNLGTKYSHATSIFLVGNPNAGKSTVFNRLTKSRAHTGNWNGVTVSANTRAIVCRGGRISVTDLPGIYGVFPVTQDEKNAVSAIDTHPNAIFVQVIDCNTLAKSLNLTLQLIERGVRVVLLPNFTKKATKRGLKIDFLCLSKMLGVPIINLDIKGRNFASEFFDLIQNIAHKLPQPQQKKHSTAIERKREITRILAECVTGRSDSPYAFTRLDTLLTSRVFGVPIFLVLLLVTFGLTFGVVGKFLSEIAVSAWELCVKVILALCSTMHAPEWFTDFLGEGVLGSVGGIIGFLPQISLLWLCLEFLEQSGYISRVVWLLEPLFARLGLSGKSAFPMLLGFGCTTLATPTVLAIKSCPAREKTACILPYFCCNAKLPVLLCIASAIFPNHTTIAVFLLYLLGVAVAIISAWFWQKIRPTPPQTEIFEFTPLAFPNFGVLLQKTLLTAVRFLRKIWGVVLVFGIVIWFVSNFDFALSPTEIEDSILAQIAQIFTPIFAPLGFCWGSVVALIVGVVAKEMVLSTIAVLNGTTALATSLLDAGSVVHFDAFSGVAFLVFVALYTPCISALTQLYSVLPRKKFLAQIATQFALAYILSLIISLVAKTLAFCGVGAVVLVVIVAVLCATSCYFALKRLFCYRKCDKSCNFCNRS